MTRGARLMSGHRGEIDVEKNWPAARFSNSTRREPSGWKVAQDVWITGRDAQRWTPVGRCCACSTSGASIDVVVRCRCRAFMDKLLSE